MSKMIECIDNIIGDNSSQTEIKLATRTKETLDALNWTSQEIQFIENLVSRLTKAEAVQKIWLYGSMSRGDQDSDPSNLSDIDVAVEIVAGVYPDDMFRRDLQIPNGRQIQINFFPVGYDETTRDALGEDDVTYITDEFGEIQVTHRSDYPTWRAAQDASKRLKDQIVLWSQT